MGASQKQAQPVIAGSELKPLLAFVILVNQATRDNPVSVGVVIFDDMPHGQGDRHGRLCFLHTDTPARLTAAENDEFACNPQHAAA